jgi:hypothetical protein
MINQRLVQFPIRREKWGKIADLKKSKIKKGPEIFPYKKMGKFPDKNQVIKGLTNFP